MKKELDPRMVAAILVLTVGGIGGLLYWKTGGMYPIQADSKSMPMPKSAAEGMAKMQAQREAQRKQNAAGAQGGGTP